MSKLNHKKLILFFLPFILCCCVILLSTFLINNYAKHFGRFVSDAAGPLISIETVVLSPSKEIKVNGVRFGEPSGSVLKMDSVTFECSFLELFNKKLVLNKIHVDGTHIDVPYGGDSFSSEDLFFQLMKTRLKEQKEGFKVVFDKTEICFNNTQINFFNDEDVNGKRSLVVNFCIGKNRNRITCKGEVDYDKSSLINRALKSKNLRFLLKNNRFILDAEAMGPDVLVNKIEFALGGFSLAGSGMISNFFQNPVADIKFYSSTIPLDKIKSLKKYSPTGGNIGLTGNLKGDLSSLNLQSELTMPTLELMIDDDPLTLDHLSCLLNYNFKEGVLSIKGLRGCLDNHLDILINGKVQDIFSPFWDIQCNITPKHISEKKIAWFSKSAIRLRGKFDDGHFKGHISAKTYNKEKTKQYILAFDDLFLTEDESSRNIQDILIKIPVVRITEKIKSESSFEDLQSFKFNDINLSLGIVGKRTKINKMTMEGYGGKILAKGNILFRYKGAEYTITLDLDDLHLKDIRLPEPFDCKISGNLSGIILIDSKKGPLVKGLVMANAFDLSGLDPLDNVADFIGISSIKNIANSEIAVDFELLPQKTVVKKFDFDSPEIAMRSSFNINKNKWLEGSIALSLPRSILEESKIFKTLLSMAREREDLLDFVVHLSGFVGALRTELVKSDFRDKLKERASVGIQKRIEREINKFMKGPL